jgi:hypothetical protein
MINYNNEYTIIVKVEDEKIHMSHVALVRQQDNDGNVAVQNLRASREKSGNHLLANPPTCYYKYVYIIVDSQSCCLA